MPRWRQTLPIFGKHPIASATIAAYCLVVKDYGIEKREGPARTALGCQECRSHRIHVVDDETPMRALSTKMLRNTLWTVVSIVMLQWCLTAASNAQELMQPPSGLRLASSDGAARTTAKTLSVRGECDYSADGVTFNKLERTPIFEQGTVIRTGVDAQTDLFFRRTGATVRLQAGTEIKLEKMTVTVKDGLPIVRTLLDLRKGRICAVVRSKFAGSTLEIRNEAGRSLVEGSGVGRYIITADGTHVSAEGSVIPLKVISKNGIAVVAAGQQFDKKNGKMRSVDPNLWGKELSELDQLQAVTEGLAQQEHSPKP